VGNVMVDTLRWALPKAEARDPFSRFGLEPLHYGLVTLHRPANVDDPQVLDRLWEALVGVSRDVKLVFPVHPRTEQRLAQFGLGAGRATDRLVRLPPLGYLDFLALVAKARLVITDSGGLQEEATALGIPCLTVRPNTERPITVTEGTSTLVGQDPQRLRDGVGQILAGRYKQGRCPALWDGQAAPRIARVLVERGRRRGEDGK
jgi:UDP-N-acetylglucosamine 2-epimerase (non-hydrolysing)